MNLCNCISKKEEYKEAYVNILKYICEILDDVPANPKIRRLQDDLSPLKRIIYYLLDKIGIALFAFNYHTPY